MTRPTFAVIGVGGFVARRHLEAIKSVNGEILAALDPHDSVGILDSYAPNCAYFKEPERFWRWMARRHFEGEPKPDWVVVCSPNWLHDAHVRMALMEDCKVILEKPAVLTTRNFDCILKEYEHDCWYNVFVCHQLRWHPDAMGFRKYVEGRQASFLDHRFKVKIVYHTPRGPWYRHSWKGDHERSGGPISNLGIHFLDMLTTLFGYTNDVLVSERDKYMVKGFLRMTRADVDFSLSTRFEDAPGGMPRREFTIDDEHSFRFDSGFTGLHNELYADAMKGEGVMLAECREPIKIAEKIRLAGLGSWSKV